MGGKKQNTTIQAAIMQPVVFPHSRISDTHTQTSNIQNSLALTAGDRVTTPVTISRRSSFTYIKMEVLSGLITTLLTLHTQTHACSLKISRHKYGKKKRSSCFVFLF